MSDRQFIAKTLKSVLCIGASTLVLSACMPDDETTDRSADRGHQAGQVTHYAQAFQQYGSRSLNAVVNSDLWASQTLPQGQLTLTNTAMGNIEMGAAEAYIQSAYCVIGDTAQHLTWFEQADAEGKLFLQGLGKDRAGQTAAYLRGMIAKENFGVARGGTIEMADGSTVNPSGACASLNIPEGSAVAFMPIPEPINVASIQEKYVMRAVNCPVGTEGNSLQRVMATYHPSGNITVGGSSFSSEGAIMASDGLSWEVVSNNCLTPTEVIARTVATETVNGLEMANLITIPGEIQATLNSNLNNKDCRDVNQQEKVDEQGNTISVDEYDTCAGAEDVETLEGITGDDRLVRTTEENISAQCGGDPASEYTIALDLNQPIYPGVDNALHGKNAIYAQTGLTGTSTYTKTTRFYEIVENHGSGGRGNATSDGNCANGDCREFVTYTGGTIQCNRDETLTIPCEAIFSPGGQLVESNPLVYRRSNGIRGWADATTLTPNALSNDGWQQGSMQCVWKQDDQFACPPNLAAEQIGLKTRSATATNPSSISQGDWQTTQNAICTGGNRTAKLAVKPVLTKDSFGQFGNGSWDISKYSVENNAYSADSNSTLNGYGTESGSLAAQGNIAQSSICAASAGANFIGIDTTIDIFEERYAYNHLSQIVQTLSNGTTPVQQIPIKQQQIFNTSGEDLMKSMMSQHFIETCIKFVTDAAQSAGLNIGYTRAEAQDWVFGTENFGNWTSLITFTGDMEGSLTAMKYSCMTGDTLVAMADNSFKAIKDIREGDITLAGRVNKTYARDYDSSSQYTSVGKVIYRGGMYDYQGVKVTGNHVVRDGNQWVEVADSAMAELLFDTTTTMVYNLDVENGFIPVQGNDGVIYFADNLNNINRSAENGFKNVMNLIRAA